MASQRRTRQHSVSVIASTGVKLSSNGQRQAVFFSTHLVETYWVAFGTSAATNSGITIPPNSHGVWVTRDQIGDDIGQEIHAIGTGVANVGWLEVSGE